MEYPNEYGINDSLIHRPKHYLAGGIETIDYIRAKLSQDELKGYYKGNILKYLSRATQKEAEAQDYEKALWYMRKLVQLVDPLYQEVDE